MNSACGLRHRIRFRAFAQQAIVLLISILCFLDSAFGQQTEPLPSFQQLEAEGAIIGEIRIDNRNIFDLNDPKEDNFLYRLANNLHIRTRPTVIRNALLFKSGETVSVQRIEETERNLRGNSYLYDVQIRPIAYNNGIVDIEVVTKDTWTLDPGLGFSRKGGSNESTFGLKEVNLLGTGVGIEWQRTEADEGTSDQFQFNNNQVLGTRVQFNYTYDDTYDGSGHFVSLVRPFYSLDSRWTAGIQGSVVEQLANISSTEYDRNLDAVSIFGGWSKGLIARWTQRYSAGLDYSRENYQLRPDQPPPSDLPLDETRVSPFLRYQVIEDSFVKTKNRNEVERPEYFLLGFSSDLRVGYAATALGSTRPAWTYYASINNGWDLSRNRILVAAASVSGVYTEGDDEDQLLSGSVEYFVPQSSRSQTFVGLTVNAANDILASNQLSLGGENGLPGYPADYQTGDRRVLLNLEQRLYSDWYPFRLFRVGGGVFFDTGRAWGGEDTTRNDQGWLSNVGFGLRVFSVRSAFGTVWRLDLAFPINPADNVPDRQILFYRSTNF